MAKDIFPRQKRAFFLVICIVIQLFLSSCDRKRDDSYLRYYQKGEIFLNEKKNLNALEYFNKSIKSNPDYFNSYIMRATAYIELKEYSKASNDLKKVINGDYGDYAIGAANYMMFFVYSKQRMRKKAFAYLDKSLGGKGGFFETNPTFIAKGYMDLYGTSLLKERKFKEAQNVFLKALEYFPNEYQHYTSLAYIEEKYYLNSNKALQYLKKAKELSGGKITQDPKVSFENLKSINSLLMDK